MCGALQVAVRAVGEAAGGVAEVHFVLFEQPVRACMLCDQPRTHMRGGLAFASIQMALQPGARASIPLMDARTHRARAPQAWDAWADAAGSVLEALPGDGAAPQKDEL